MDTLSTLPVLLADMMDTVMASIVKKPRSLPEILRSVRQVLHLRSQGALGRVLDVSARTTERWARGETSPKNVQLHALARAVHAKSPELALELAFAARTTLDALGLATKPAVAAPPVRARPPAATIVDTIVCAAADTMGVAPGAVRPALRAAFLRARDAQFTIDEVALAFGGEG